MIKLIWKTTITDNINKLYHREGGIMNDKTDMEKNNNE